MPVWAWLTWGHPAMVTGDQGDTQRPTGMPALAKRESGGPRHVAPVTAMGGCVCVPLQKLHLASPLSLTFDDLFWGGIQLYFHFSSAEFTQPSPQICLGRRDAGDSEMGTPCLGGGRGGPS